jgi:hypothetical protein
MIYFYSGVADSNNDEEAGNEQNVSVKGLQADDDKQGPESDNERYQYYGFHCLC